MSSSGAPTTSSHVARAAPTDQDGSRTHTVRHVSHPDRGGRPVAGPSEPRAFSKDGWRIETCKRPILSAHDSDASVQSIILVLEVRPAEATDRLSDRLGIPLPEICFGHNSLQLSYTSADAGSPSFTYSFETSAALDGVDKTGKGEGMVKVSYADKWLKGTKPVDGGIRVVKPYDWTYTTAYPGHAGPSSCAFEPAEADHPGIPLDRLTRPDPILFFEEVPLFEDELHDNGMSSLIVRVRVMPTCLFVLSRFFLRVDGVLFRLLDVRLFHSFSSAEIVREIRGREASYDEVKARLPPERPHDLTPLTDANWVADKVGMLRAGGATVGEARTRPRWEAEGRRLDVARLPGPTR